MVSISIVIVNESTASTFPRKLLISTIPNGLDTRGETISLTTKSCVAVKVITAYWALVIPLIYLNLGRNWLLVKERPPG